MLLNTLMTTILSSSKILHQCVTSRGSITLWCAAIATSANSKLSIGQSACDVYATIVWLSAMRASCDAAIVWNFGSWTLTVMICKWLYRDTVLYIKANSSDCPLPYWQHVVGCRSQQVHPKFHTVQLLQCKTLNFLSSELWPHNSPIITWCWLYTVKY